jgi:hypothetical protein
LAASIPRCRSISCPRPASGQDLLTRSAALSPRTHRLPSTSLCGCCSGDGRSRADPRSEQFRRGHPTRRHGRHDGPAAPAPPCRPARPTPPATAAAHARQRPAAWLYAQRYPPAQPYGLSRGPGKCQVNTCRISLIMPEGVSDGGSHDTSLRHARLALAEPVKAPGLPGRGQHLASVWSHAWLRSRHSHYLHAPRCRLGRLVP